MKYFFLISLCAVCFAMSIKAHQTNNSCSSMNKADINISGNKIYVFGGVFKPQSINSLVKDPLKLSEVIAMSGGFTKDAVIQEIQIVKCSSNLDSIENVIFIDFREITKGNLAAVELTGGQIIYNPKKSKSELNWTLPLPNLISESKN